MARLDPNMFLPHLPPFKESLFSSMASGSACSFTESLNYNVVCALLRIDCPLILPTAPLRSEPTPLPAWWCLHHSMSIRYLHAYGTWAFPRRILPPLLPHRRWHCIRRCLSAIWPACCQNKTSGSSAAFYVFRACPPNVL